MSTSTSTIVLPIPYNYSISLYRWVYLSGRKQCDILLNAPSVNREMVASFFNVLMPYSVSSGTCLLENGSNQISSANLGVSILAVSKTPCRANLDWWTPQILTFESDFSSNLPSRHLAFWNCQALTKLGWQFRCPDVFFCFLRFLVQENAKGGLRGHHHPANQLWLWWL